MLSRAATIGRSSPSNQNISPSRLFTWSCQFIEGVSTRSPGCMSQASPFTVV
jgi:hypothetical protein